MRPRSIMATLAIVAFVAAALLLSATSTQSQSVSGGSRLALLNAIDVAAAGDFDGDKRVDLIVAAHDDFGRERPPSLRGAVVVLGARLTPRGLLAQRVVQINRPLADDASVSIGGVAPAGDVNGDGLDDVVLSDGPRLDDGTAAEPLDEAVFVLYGSRSPKDIDLDRPDQLDGRGFALQGFGAYARASGAGDVNGDGFDDLVVGASGSFASYYGTAITAGQPGAAYVVFGGKASTTVRNVLPLDSGGFSIHPGPHDRGLGAAIAGAGDVNGDGLADIIVGAPGSGARSAGAATIDPGRAGAAYVVFGKRDGEPVRLGSPGSAAFRIAGDFASWGSAVAGVGDVNGDQLADVALGGPLLRGPLPARARAMLDPDSPDSGFSGREDHLVELDAFRARGAAAVVFGRRDRGPVDLRRLGDGGLRLEGVRPAGKLGTRVAAAGDRNRDGLADFAVAEFGPVLSSVEDEFMDAFERPARVHIVYGRRAAGRIALGARSAVRTLRSESNIGAPLLLAWGTDLDADGRDELLVRTSFSCAPALLAVEPGDPAADRGAGPDVLRGSANADQLLGRDGDDRLDGLAAHDCLYGGDGDDVLRGGGGLDDLTGGNGDDRLLGGFSEDALRGGAGADILDGGPGHEQAMRGGDGPDILRGGAGADWLHGGNGDDRLFGGSGDDNMTGGAGRDLVDCGPGNDSAIIDEQDRGRNCERVSRR